MKSNNWRDKYDKPEEVKSYKLEDSADDSTLNRMIKIKAIDNTKVVEGKAGILYLDKSTGEVKMFISKTVGWVTLDYTPVP